MPTWKDMNREEINTLTALDELRNRDLSVHLYNTHALKQRHKDPENNNNGPEPEKVIFIHLASLISPFKVALFINTLAGSGCCYGPDNPPG